MGKNQDPGLTSRIRNTDIDYDVFLKKMIGVHGYHIHYRVVKSNSKALCHVCQNFEILVNSVVDIGTSLWLFWIWKHFLYFNK